MGYFFENGPTSLMNTTEPVPNEFSWTQAAHMLYLDSPAGTGFSQGTIPTTAAGVASRVVEVLTALLGEGGVLSEIGSTGLFIAGESYSGRVVPLVAASLLKGEAGSTWKPRLLGIAIGNGLIDPEVQVKAHADFMYSTGLIGVEQRELAALSQGNIVVAIRSGDLKLAGELYQNYTVDLMEASGWPDPSDIRHYGFTRLEVFQRAVEYLNRPAVRAKLGVGSRTFNSSCSSAVSEALSAEEMGSSADVLPLLLTQIKVLLYNGNFDFTVPVSGIEGVLGGIDWPGRIAFRKAKRTVWKRSPDDENVWGYTQVYSNLFHYVIAKAGHMALMDQPEAGLRMITSFIAAAHL